MRTKYDTHRMYGSTLKMRGYLWRDLRESCEEDGLSMQQALRKLVKLYTEGHIRFSRPMIGSKELDQDYEDEY